jgi:hypothetical protein
LGALEYLLELVFGGDILSFPAGTLLHLLPQLYELLFPKFLLLLLLDKGRQDLFNLLDRQKAEVLEEHV